MVLFCNVRESFCLIYAQNSSIFAPFRGRFAGVSRFSGNAFKIREAFHVVNQVQESYLRRGPQPPDTSDPSTVHEFYLSKHMFYTRSDFGFLPVLCQLRFRQGRSASPFDTYPASVPEIIETLLRLFRMICTVGKHRCARIVGIQKRLKHVGVVHLGRCRRIVADDLVLHVHRCMVLIAEKCLAVLLRPPCVNIFLTKFLRVLFPFLRRTAVLDLVIFFPRISLARCLNKTCIYYLAFLRGISRLIQLTAEQIKQLLENARLRQRFPKQPDGLFVGNTILGGKPKKPFESQPIQYLKLGLRVGKTIHRLQDEYLEHQDIIVRRPTGIALPFLAKNLINHRPKALPPYDSIDGFKRVAHLGKLGKAVLKIKKAYLPHDNILQTIVVQSCCLESI
jgi:hypothetical protein